MTRHQPGILFSALAGFLLAFAPALSGQSPGTGGAAEPPAATNSYSIEEAWERGDRDEVLFLAKKLMGEDRLYVAAGYCRKIFDGDPSVDDAFQLTVYYLEKTGNEGELVAVLEKRAAKVRDAETCLRLGNHYKRKNDPDRAYRYFREAQDIAPSAETEFELKSLAAKKFVVSAEAAFGRKDYEAAALDYGRAAEVFPDNYDLIVTYANCLYLLARYDLAMASLQNAVRISSVRPEAWQIMGLLYTDRQEWTNSLRCFLEALKYAPMEARNYLKCGQIYYRLKAWDLGLKYLVKAESLDPRNAEVCLAKGQIRLKRKEYREALTELEKAASLGIGQDLSSVINDLKVWNYVDEANRTADTGAAIDLYLKASELKQDPEIWTGLGNLYFKKKDFPAAITNFRRALGLDPRKIEALKGISSAYREAGDLESANSLLSELEKLRGSDPEIACRFGMLYEKEGRYEKAIESYEQALRLDPGYLTAATNIGACRHSLAAACYAKNDLRQAAVEIKKALEIEPGNLDYKDVLNKIETAEKAAQIRKLFDEARDWTGRGQYDRSVTNLTRIMGMNPDLPAPRYLLAKNYYLKKDFRQAENVYNRIRLDFPSDRGILIALGQFYLETGRPEKAESWFRESLEKGTNTVQALTGLGDASLFRRNYARARTNYARALEINGRYLHALIGMANLGYYEKNYDEALKYYRKALEIDPANKSALYGSGVIYLRRSQYGQAEAALLKADRGDNDPDVNFSLGKCYYNSGNYRNALSFMSRTTQFRKSVTDKWALANIYHKMAGAEKTPEAQEFRRKSYGLLVECLRNADNPEISLMARRKLIFDSPTGAFFNPGRFKPGTKHDVVIDRTRICSELSNHNIVCFDKFTEQKYWQYDNRLPLSSQFVLADEGLAVPVESGEVLVLDPATGALRSRIPQYARLVFGLEGMIVTVDDKNRFCCYRDGVKQWEAACPVREVRLSSPRRCVVYDAGKVAYLDMKKRGFTVLDAPEAVSSVHASPDVAGLLSTDGTRTTLSFLDLPGLGNGSRLEWDGALRMRDSDNRNILLSGPGRMVLVDVADRTISWSREFQDREIETVSLRSDSVCVLFKDREVGIFDRTDGSDIAKYRLDEDITKNGIYTLYYRK
jgi:tetratricopeptide (TPR) repeat protein